MQKHLHQRPQGRPDGTPINHTTKPKRSTNARSSSVVDLYVPGPSFGTRAEPGTFLLFFFSLPHFFTPTSHSCVRFCCTDVVLHLFLALFRAILPTMYPRVRLRLMR